MNSAKITFVLWFVAFCSLAQDKVIGWAHTYHYDKSSFGEDFRNTEGHIQIASDGSLLLAPYSSPFFRLKNASYSIEAPSGYFKGYFQLNAKEYYCLESGIYLKNDDNQYQRLPLFDENQEVHKVILHKGIFYFMIRKPEASDVTLFSYDGEKTTEIQKNILLQDFFTTNQGDLYTYSAKNGTKFFKIENGSLNLVKSFKKNMSLIYVKSLDDFYYRKNVDITKLYHYDNGKETLLFTNDKTIYTGSYNRYYLQTQNRLTSFYDLAQSHLSPLFQTHITSANVIVFAPETHSYYVGTNQNLQRIFPYIRKYPLLFNGENSESIFSLTQTQDGKIWAGTYNGGFVLFDNQRLTKSADHEIRPIFAKKIGNKVLLAEDTSQYRVLLFENEKDRKILNDSITGYYAYVDSKETIYVGTHRHGLMFKPLQHLENQVEKWQFAGVKEGFAFENVLSITEDKFGNIWTTNGSRGISVYQPEKQKFINFKTQENKLHFGSMTSLKDTFGTLWLGSRKGELIYWNGKHKDDFKPENFVRIKHPLFRDTGLAIAFLHQWENWLIIGNDSRVLLFDLKTWHQKQQVRVRYLNPMETSFQSDTEQNTIFTDIRDKSIWFSTSDMLYQWDIENWLKLPTFKVVPQINVRVGEQSFKRQPNEKLVLESTQKSINIHIDYQSIDNMPRYLGVRLVGNKTSFNNGKISDQIKYDFQNLPSGKYTFYLTICQQDGSFDTYEYPIEIEYFMWEKWWFWALVILASALGTYKYFATQRKINFQRYEISQLQLANLGKQFRPHFMLNALNSLGADLRDKPHAERIISRIGENINIIHQFSKKNQISICFEQEWKLTLNTIEIHKEIFIKELETQIIGAEIIPKDYQIPIGIVQMVVENALLHGIRHRKQPPYLLKIEFLENEKYFSIIITDNGVGMEISKNFYDFAKNGTGLSNIATLIAIINASQKKAFSLKTEPSDTSNPEYVGTKVTITMKKSINYKKINPPPPPPRVKRLIISCL